jgi:hypothetical protein
MQSSILRRCLYYDHTRLLRPTSIRSPRNPDVTYHNYLTLLSHDEAMKTIHRQHVDRLRELMPHISTVKGNHGRRDSKDQEFDSLLVSLVDDGIMIKHIAIAIEYPNPRAIRQRVYAYRKTNGYLRPMK